MHPVSTLQPGDVVQMNERCKNPWFIGCFMTVTELKSFGAMGFVQIPGFLDEGAVCVIKGGRGQAFYRPCWDEMEFIGKAALMPKESEEK